MHIPLVYLLVLLACLMLATPAAAQLPSRPDFNSPACSQPAVTDLKITNDRWPDASSPLQFALDAIRLENAKTDQDKAIALWLWVRRFTMYTNGNPPADRVPAGSGYVSDPMKILNVWGAHWCDGLSRCMELSWRQLGLPAQKFYKAGHTLCDVGWVDDDGVMRYHLFDVSEGWFAFTRDGRRIASAEEICRDWSLVYRPAIGPALRMHSLNSLWGWVHATHLPIDSPHKMELQMRPDESFIRFWANLGKPFQDNVRRDRDAVPEEHGPFRPDYGNGIWAFGIRTDEAGLAAQTIEKPANAKCVKDEAGESCIDPVEAGKPVILTYRILSPYIISSLGISGAGFGAGECELSDDGGKTWRASVDYEFAPETKDGGDISAFGRYDVRIRLIAPKGFIAGTKVNTMVQHNIYSLPQLLPGDNRVTIHGKLGKGQAVRVTYVWDDPAGKDRKNVTVAEQLPFSYTVRAAGSKWGDVICRSLNVETIQADGKGSRTMAKETDSPLEQMAPMPSYLLSLGKSPVPPLKSLDEYLAVLKTVTNRNELAEALAGIRVIAFNAPNVTADSKAYDAVRQVAMSNLDRPKLQALQVMYWLDRRRATADFLKIVNEQELELKLLADEKLDPIKVDVIEDDRDPKSVRRGHFYNVVAQASRFLADEKCTDAVPALVRLTAEQERTRDEPRRALLRSLGELGDRRALPVLIKYAAANPDDAQIAVESLGLIGDPAGIDAVRKRAKDSYTPLRRNALLALGRLGDRDSLPLLRDALRDKDEDARTAAAEAIGLLRDAASIDALTEAAETERIAWTKTVMRQAIEKTTTPLP